jgi:hypothetical protein
VLDVADATEHKGILYPGVVFSEQGPRDSKFPRGSKIRRRARGGTAAVLCGSLFCWRRPRAGIARGVWGGGGLSPVEKN